MCDAGVLLPVPSSSPSPGPRPPSHAPHPAIRARPPRARIPSSRGLHEGRSP